MKIKTTLQFSILLIASALAASTSFFFFPAVKAAGVAPAVAIAFASTLTQFLAVVYFLISLPTIKRGLKAAYALFAGGIFLFSFAQLVPSLSVFTSIISQNADLSSFAIVIPYATGTLVIFLGMRKFAQLLKVQSMWATKFWLGLVVSAVMAAAAALAYYAHEQHAASRIAAVIYASVAWSAVFSFMAMMSSLRVKSVIGPAYKPALRWVSVALGVLAFTALHEFIVRIYFATSSYASASWSLWPFLFVGVLLLKASLDFAAANRQRLSLPAQATYVDVVTAVAGLVSRPQDIDKTLDTVRTITATRTSDQLSAADKATLVKVYLYLEQYLMTNEPLHRYTREDLRDSLPADFLHELPQTS